MRNENCYIVIKFCAITSINFGDDLLSGLTMAESHISGFLYASV